MAIPIASIRCDHVVRDGTADRLPLYCDEPSTHYTVSRYGSHTYYCPAHAPAGAAAVRGEESE